MSKKDKHHGRGPEKRGKADLEEEKARLNRIATLKEKRRALMAQGLEQRSDTREELERIRSSLDAINEQLLGLGAVSDVVAPWI